MTICYRDITGIHFKEDGETSRVNVTLKDGASVLFDCPSLREDTGTFYKFLLRCLNGRGYSVAVDAGPIYKTVKCRACGAQVDIGPGSSGRCEYCGTECNGCF